MPVLSILTSSLDGFRGEGCFVENAWSLFKRGLVGMYHHVSTKYLQEYLGKFAFRYSHRYEKAKLLDLVLASSSC